MLDEWAQHPDRGCAGVDPDFFFPVSTTSPQVEAAKAVCRPCPVRRECLEHAMTRGEKGIWGGTDEVERKRARLYAGHVLSGRRRWAYPSADVLAARPALAYALGHVDTA